MICFQEVFNPDWAEEICRRTGFEYRAAQWKGGLLILSRFKIPASDSLKLKAVSSKEDYGRYVLFAEIEGPSFSVSVFNTHWSWRLDESAVRQKQAEEFLRYADECSGGRAAIACGDFNTTAWSPEIRILKESGWQDAYALKYPEKPGLTWENENLFARSASSAMPDRRIDYVFFKGPEFEADRLEKAEVVFQKPSADGLWASDHYGVSAVWK